MLNMKRQLKLTLEKIWIHHCWYQKAWKIVKGDNLTAQVSVSLLENPLELNLIPMEEIREPAPALVCWCHKNVSCRGFLGRKVIENLIDKDKNVIKMSKFGG